MSQNSSAYQAYTLDTKTGLPPPRFSLAIGEPSESDPKPRGVARLPVSAHDSSEEAINALIVEKVTDLAKDTKRVYGVPKRLQDGIALDWVYDKGVQQEDIHTILRKIGLKLEPSTREYFARPARLGPERSEPVFDSGSSGFTLDKDRDQVRSVSTPVRKPLLTADVIRSTTRDIINSTHHSIPSKRSMDTLFGDESRFMLPNLSGITSPETLHDSLLAAKIPDDAISDIRIHQSPIGKFAVISVAEGFAASDIRRQYMEGGIKHRPAGPAQAVPSFDDVIDLTLEDSSPERSQDSRSSQIVETRPSIVIQVGVEKDGTPADAQEEQPLRSNVSGSVSLDDENIPSQASPIIISSDSEDDHMQIPEEAEGTLSPALSYLTLDERLSDAPLVNDNAAPFSDITDTTRRWGWDCDDSESSETSAEDSSVDEMQTGNPPATVGEEPSGMDLIKQRLLTGGNVDEILDELPPEQRHRIQEYLEISAASRHCGNSNCNGGESKWASASSSDSEWDTGEFKITNHPKTKTKRDRIAVARDSRRRASRRIPETPRNAPCPIEDGGLSVVLPKADHARGRRILVPRNRRLPIAAVYMRGDVQFINQSKDGVRHRMSAAGLPAYDANQGIRRATDATLLDDDVGVISYQLGPAQISCILFDEEHPRRVDLAHRGHSTVVEHKVKGTASRNPGISTLAPLSHSSRQFLSGGGDGTIRLWTLRAGRGGEMTGTSTHLWEDYFPPIRCAAYTHASGKVLFASSKSIYTRDLSGTKSSEELVALSAAPRQIHIHSDNPSVVILEVDHLDRQMNLYDLRTSNFNARPSMEFGHREAKRGSVYRYTKGSIDGQRRLFVRGFDGDGTVHLWDYRNAKEAIKRFERQREPITHTVLSDDSIIAYGGYQATFWKYP